MPRLHPPEPRKSKKQLEDARAARDLVLSDAPDAWDQRWQLGFQRFADAVEGRGRPHLHHDNRPAAAARLAEPASPPPDDRPIWGHARDFRAELQALQTCSHEQPKVVCALTGLAPALAGLDRLSFNDDKVAPVVSFDMVRCAAGIDKHPVTKCSVLFELDGRPWPQGEHNDGGACAVYHLVYDVMSENANHGIANHWMGGPSMPSLPREKGELPAGAHVYVHWPALRHSGPARAGNALSAMEVDSPLDSATPRWLSATGGLELAGQHYRPQDEPQKILLGTMVLIQWPGGSVQLRYDADGKPLVIECDSADRPMSIPVEGEQMRELHRRVLELDAYTEQYLMEHRPPSAIPALIPKQLDVFLQATRASGSPAGGGTGDDLAAIAALACGDTVRWSEDTPPPGSESTTRGDTSSWFEWKDPENWLPAPPRRIALLVKEKLGGAISDVVGWLKHTEKGPESVKEAGRRHGTQMPRIESKKRGREGGQEGEDEQPREHVGADGEAFICAEEDEPEMSDEEKEAARRKKAVYDLERLAGRLESCSMQLVQLLRPIVTAADFGKRLNSKDVYAIAFRNGVQETSAPFGFVRPSPRLPLRGCKPYALPLNPLTPEHVQALVSYWAEEIFTDEEVTRRELGERRPCLARPAQCGCMCCCMLLLQRMHLPTAHTVVAHSAHMHVC